MEHTMVTLNVAQQQAVSSTAPALLVLAGAGSGKTRVLVQRIAWLVTQQNVQLRQILAVTFTNKAAHEMRARLQELLHTDISQMWVGTFHGLAHKILRLHAGMVGLVKDFQILDSDDQLKLIKKIGKELGLHEEEWEPRKIQGWINKVKDNGQRSHHIQATQEPWLPTLYRHYEHYCLNHNLVDFAELLLRCTELFDQNPELRAQYQQRFQHFLVDEFQDTNTIQYKWLRLLAERPLSITIVGDDDQSIYGWRGAKIENLSHFKRDYENVECIKLEQNYRSTGIILKAANALIKHNAEREGKELWTESQQGLPISVLPSINEEEEGFNIVRALRKMTQAGYSFADIGVLYRSNAQSRILEEAFVKNGVPYTIYGGLRFFERAEIKDALAYLRLVAQTADNVAFERVINSPPRGIGDRSLAQIIEHATTTDVSYWQATTELVQARALVGKAAVGAEKFLTIIRSLTDMAQQGPLADVIAELIKISGLIGYFKQQKGERALSKIENLQELVSAVKDFEIQYADQELSALTAFLSYTALEAGEYKKTTSSEAVQMMTMHAAKGLEFKVVFIAGLEEGLFPHHFSSQSPQALEEERRLCYVGITRAREKLHLSFAKRRRLFGHEEPRLPSRFLAEIPEDCLQYPEEKFVVSYPVMAHVTEDTVVGRRVYHQRFGLGVIKQIDGNGDRARVEVDFRKIGKKWMMQAYANLEMLDE